MQGQGKGPCACGVVLFSFIGEREQCARHQARSKHTAQGSCVSLPAAAEAAAYREAPEFPNLADIFSHVQMLFGIVHNSLRFR